MKTALLSAAACLAIGFGLLGVHQKMQRQSAVTVDLDARTDQLRGDVKALEETATQITSTIPHEQEQLKARIDQLANVHQSITDELQLLRLKATGERIERDRQMARLEHIRHVGSEARRELQLLKTQLAAWNGTVDALMTDDRGKWLATDDTRLSRIVTIRALADSTNIKIIDWERQIALQLRSIPEAPSTADPGISVSDEVISDAEQIAEAVRTARNQLEQQNAALHAMLKQRPDNKPVPDAPLLRDRLDAYAGEQALEAVAALTEETLRVRDEFAQRLAAEQRKSEEDLGQLRLSKEEERKKREAELIEVNSKIVSQKVADAVAQVLREEEQRQAEQRTLVEREIREAKFQAALSEIRRYLAPFTTPGNKQLQGDKWVYSDQRVPVSLGGIRATQALGNDQLGYQQIYWIGGGPHNDRPNGPFREYIGGAIYDPEVAMVRKVQTLLAEFGDQMVEKGMLAP